MQHTSPTWALVLALPSDPRLEGGQLLAEGAHLADAAALSMPVFVKGKHALFPDQVHHLLCVGKGVFDTNTIMLFHLVKEAVRLWVEAASVQAVCGGGGVVECLCGGW